MRLSDRLSGLLLVLFGLGVAAYAWTFPPATGQTVGPGAFPILLGLGLAGGGVAMGWPKRNEPRQGYVEFESWIRRPRMVGNAMLVIGALIFYAWTVETVGFFLTAFALLAVMFLAFGVRRRWIAPLGAMITLGLHVIFYTFLHVPLPWGWLERFAW